MRMKKRAIEDLSNELLLKTMKHLDRNIWKYSTATQLLLKLFELIPNDGARIQCKKRYLDAFRLV